MKRIVLSIMVLLATAGTVMAQNALSVADFTVPQNGQGTLTVSFQFDVANAYTGYSFELELPADLEFVMESGTDVAYTKGDCHDASHSVTANLSGGKVKVAGLSLSSKPLKGTSGTLLTFTVRPASPTLTVGKTYTGTISNILIVPIEGDKQNLDNSDFTVTVVSPVDDRVVLDETSTTVPVADTDVDVKVMRTINADEWSTICLPYAMTAAQIAAAFPENTVELKDFTGITSTYDGDDCTSIIVNFTDATAIAANHPYLIKLSNAVTEFKVDGVDIAPEAEPSVDKDEKIVKVGKITFTLYNRFVGTYKAQTDVPENCLFLNDNKFYYSNGSTKMKAFRAYFDFYDVLSDVENASRSIGMGDGGTTGIKGVDGEELKVKIYYDLNGRRVETPSKGVYIVNGRKLIVK